MGIYLSQPNKTKDSHSEEGEVLRYAVSAMQGWRFNMEDAHITELKLTDQISLFAVFDGHGGQEVAKFCAKYFPIELLKNENFKKENYKTALEETFLKMDALLLGENALELLKEFRRDLEGNSFAGCTANVVLLTKKELFVANAGDSRAYVYTTEGQTIPFSTDHKPDVETERTRIQNAGGYISEGRVNDNLNLTRAIGDLEYKKNVHLKPEEQIISAFPDVLSKKIDPSMKFMLIGCDGIWETLSAHDICKLVDTRLGNTKQVPIIPICHELLDKLLATNTTEGTGCDNMSLIILEFKH